MSNLDLQLQDGGAPDTCPALATAIIWSCSYAGTSIKGFAGIFAELRVRR